MANSHGANAVGFAITALWLHYLVVDLAMRSGMDDPLFPMLGSSGVLTAVAVYHTWKSVQEDEDD